MQYVLHETVIREQHEEIPETFCFSLFSSPDIRFFLFTNTGTVKSYSFLSRIYTEEYEGSTSLFIKDIVLKDTGYYTCKSDDLYQAVFLSVYGISKFWVFNAKYNFVPVGITFPEFVQHQICTLESHCLIECIVRAWPMATIDIFRDNTQLEGTVRSFIIVWKTNKLVH